MGTGDWLQFGGYLAALIWGASTMKAEIKHLREEMKQIREDLKDFKDSVADASHVISATLSDHGTRLSRVEGRLIARGDL